MIQLLYFGSIAEKVNLDTEEWSTDECLVSELNAALLEKYPVLKNEPYKIAVNQQLVRGTEKIKNGAEVALLPPFAGG